MRSRSGGSSIGQHREPVVEVRAEAPHRHHLAQVDARGRDHAHVDLGHAVRAERLDFLLLQHAQQLRLHRHGHVAHFVEEERAAVGEHELAVAARGGRRPCSADGEAPKNSASSSVSGIAATFTPMKGPWARGLAAWIACASTSLPVPVSPSSSTVVSTCAARRAWRLTSIAAGELPRKLEKVYFDAPLLGERLLGVGELGLQALELRHQRLQVLQAIEEHEARARRSRGRARP